MALAIALGVWFLVTRTVRGFEWRAVGAGREAAQASGVPAGRRICEGMALSGALAGIAGALLILGTEHRYPGVFRTGYGFDGIAVALVGGGTVWGSALAALVFGALRAGATPGTGRDPPFVRGADAGPGSAAGRGAAHLPARDAAPARTLPSAFERAADSDGAAVNLILDFAPPLVFASPGQRLSERAGVVNIGLEGMMRFGAFAAAAGAIFTGSPWFGLGCGALAGAAAAAVHAVLSLKFRADQVVSGVALNLVALGLVTYLLEAVFGSSGEPPSPALPRDRFGHSALAYAALVVPLLFHAWLAWTPQGLRVRAVGEHPRAAATLGVRVLPLRAVCVLGSGILAGVGGATLSVGLLGQFDSRMPAGQGFMALAAMVFGRRMSDSSRRGRSGLLLRRGRRAPTPALLLAARGRSPSGGRVPRAALCADAARARAGNGRTRAPAADGVPYDPEDVELWALQPEMAHLASEPGRPPSPASF